MFDVYTIDEQLLRALRAQLTVQLDSSVTNPFNTDPTREATIKAAIEKSVRELAGDQSDLLNRIDDLYDELVGLGPLQPMMEDPQTTDILVNSPSEIFIEKAGRLHRTEARFRDQAHLEQAIAKIVALVGREISIDKPLVDARMVDGSRANAVYAPVGGPALCIRKFNRLQLSLLPTGTSESWVSLGGISSEAARFLDTMAKARANILIAGATGSGKSTLLRSVVDAIPDEERIITIEDTAELELDNPHWVKLECVHQHASGADTDERKLDVADLVQNALRMRPDRLIIGEIRTSREAYYTLEALNTGHDGSATTIHASSAADALARLELLVARSFGQLSQQEIRGYISRVFNVVVFVSRLRSGERRVLEISDLAGIDEQGRYDLRPVIDQGDYQMSERLLRKLQLEGLEWKQ